MLGNKAVAHQEWLKARLELLAAEKELTRQRDVLTRRRMAMPWERVEKSYRFEGPNGALSLADLFDGRSQLIVYHFMFGPDWEEGCKSCSFLGRQFQWHPDPSQSSRCDVCSRFALHWPRSTLTGSAWTGASRQIAPPPA